MPRAWYLYNCSTTGTKPQLVAVNYNRAPGGVFNCVPDFNACAIYVYYSTSTPPPKPPAPLSLNIQRYINGNVSAAENRPIVGKIFAYCGNC